ncbi:hypothetical protein D3C84_893890 [compost metagenome]
MLAGDLDLDPDTGQGIQNRLPFCYLDRLATAGRDHFEAGAAGIDLDLEVLLVDVIFGITLFTGAVDDPLHKAGRAAGVHMHTGLPLPQHLGQVEFLLRRFVIEMGDDMLGEGCGLQLLEKCAAVARTPAVMQLEALTTLMQGIGHGDHWRDADTAPQQNAALRIVDQREQIARRADLHFAALDQGVVHAH